MKYASSSLLLLLASSILSFSEARVRGNSLQQNDERFLEGKGKGIMRKKMPKSESEGKGKSKNGDKEMVAPTQSILEIAQGVPELSTLVSLVTSPGQAPVLEALSGDGPLTLFAPLNSAFDKLFAAVDPATLSDEVINNILFYHVLDSGAVFSRDIRDGIIVASNGDGIIADKQKKMTIVLNKSVNVVKVDIGATNGVIHLIDTVLDPPDDEDTVFALTEKFGFTTLAAALEATNLNTVLGDKDAGPFTVVAPTNEAFAELGEETLNALLTTELATLDAILLYHVIPGFVGFGDIRRSKFLDTVQGSTIRVSKKGRRLNGDVKFVSVDNLASNGVVHGIDEVLMFDEMEEKGKKGKKKGKKGFKGKGGKGSGK